MTAPPPIAPDPGPTPAELQALLSDQVGFLVLGALFLVLGLAAVVLGLVRKELRHRVTLLFGVMSLLWGLRFVARAPVVPLLLGGSEPFWALFPRFLTYVSAPPAFGVVWRIFGAGWRGSLRLVFWFSAAFAVVASLMLLVVPRPDLLIGVFNVMMLVGGVVIGATMLRPEFRRHPELRTLVIGGLASLVIIIRENLRSLGLTASPVDVEWAGVIILYATLGHMAINHVIGAERRLTALNQEMDAARRIQESILPPGPPSVPGLAIASRYVPMTAVAGDLYDFAEPGDGTCGVLVADVSGHGVPAALVASMVKVAFQAQAGHHDDPAAVLAGMNRMLGSRLEGRFVTAGYAFLDPAAGVLRYAAAGHPPLLLLRRGQPVEQVVSNGLILGIMPDVPFTATERALGPGDRVLMYTDGIVEAFDPRGEEFGEERLGTLLGEASGEAPEACADRVMAAVAGWVQVGGRRALEDDLTLVVFDVAPPRSGGPDAPAPVQ